MARVRGTMAHDKGQIGQVHDMEHEENKLLTTKQVAEFLQVCTRTVTRLAQKEKLPGALKVGGQWRFPKDIVKILRESKT